ncbi:hypothetical protein D3C85_1226150 [compost metagenome]
MPLAAPTLDEIEHRVAVFAVHAVDGMFLAQQCGADLQGGEVQGHENGTLAITLGSLQVFQPFDVRQARQAGLWPPPAHGHLEEGDAGGGEIFLEQTLPFDGR